MSLNDFEIFQNIGHEENSSLLKVKRKKDGLIYLLKTVAFQSLDKSEKQSAINEIKIVSSLSHPNINQFKEAFFDKLSKSLNIIFEFPQNGNLSNKINYAIKNGMYMEECVIWNVLVQILNGVNYLHKKGIIHRNLKSKNIFLNNQKLVKISDFEASCVVENNKMITGQVGTPFFTAPEIWNEEPYNYKCDIWSIGCIIYEMTSLTLPFKGDTIESLYENIISKNFKPIPDFYSEDLKKIISFMLIFDPSERPSTDLLLNYPRIKEELAKVKDIYKKYQINKNSRNIQNRNNLQIVKEQNSDSNLYMPLKGKTQLNEPLTNKILNLKSLNSAKISNLAKIYLNDLSRNKSKKIINNTKYRTLKERLDHNLVEKRRKSSRSHSKKKNNNRNFNNLNNISTIRMQTSSLNNKINEKVGLSFDSMKKTDINLFLSASKLKNNLVSLNPNLKNNGEIKQENEGENNNEPIIPNYNYPNTYKEFYICPRSSFNKKRNYTLKQSPSFKTINFNIHKNLTEHNIVSDDNMANKNNKEIIVNYINKDNLNLEYMRKCNNRSRSNKKILKKPKNKALSKNFHDINYSTPNSIILNDLFLKDNNNLDNGNCGNQLEFKMLHNNTLKPKQSKVKLQNNNNIDTNNNVKNRQNYAKKLQPSLLNNDNTGEIYSDILNYKNTNKIPLEKFINKNPINFNECQILTNNSKIIRYKNNLIDFKFDNKGNSYIMAINNINNLQECEDILLSSPKNKNSNLNRINKLTTNFYKKFK